MAGPRRRPRDRAGQRELDVVRQGSRRSAPAGEAAAAARRGGEHRPGARRLPPAGRDRPGLVEAIATTPGVAPYFDLSFQHSSETVLRRMRRFGSTERFSSCSHRSARGPDRRSPQQLHRRLPGRDRGRRRRARAIPDRCAPRCDRRLRLLRRGRHRGRRAARQGRRRRPSPSGYERVARTRRGAVAQRAEDRIGEAVEVLVDTVRSGIGSRAAAEHQAPEVDGSTSLVGAGLRRLRRAISSSGSRRLRGRSHRGTAG